MAENECSAAGISDSQKGDATNIEWAQIALNKVVVATTDRAWLYQPHSGNERFARPMEGAGSFATTQKLIAWKYINLS